MKRTNPPLQFIFVGFESNQQGHAASQEQASSRSPEIFHGVDLAAGLSSARAGPTANRTARTARRTRKRVMHTSFEGSVADILDGSVSREVTGSSRNIR